MKRLLFLLLAVSTIVSLNGAPVSHADALKIASNFMKVRMGEKSMPVETLTEVALDRSLQLEHLYIFTGKHSFVILSADDRAMPVLGYALDRPFETENMPVNMLSWLQGYDYEIRYLEEHGVEASKSVKEAWETLSQGSLWQPVNRAEVQPLMATQWGQHDPFNYYCPGNCVTGCVATAMSQIMKYWEYPNKGTGSHSYYHDTYGTLSANFGSTTYDWDQMTFKPSSSCSLAEKQALGKLLFQSGVAVEMYYGTEISSAFSADVPEAMIQYFGYNPETVMDEMSYYTNAGWKTLIKGELNQARPVYYAGNNSTSTGGHAFICDGYDNRDYFHFNWGWTGNHDAYYMIGSLNPDSSTDLNFLNRIITGLYPASYAIQAPTNLRATVQGNDVRLSWNASSGASSYNVYRNGYLVATQVTGTNYTDVAPGYGSHSYFVKALKSNGDRSPRSTSAEVHIAFTFPTPTGLQGQFSHDNASLKLTWNAPIPNEKELRYGAGTVTGLLGYNGEHPTYWAQRYPLSDVISYAGMNITNVQVYFYNTGTYTLYLYSGNELGTGDLLYQRTYTCNTLGYNDIRVTSTIPLDYMNDLWVVLYAPASITHPAVYCDYSGPGLENASFISNTGNSWLSYASQNRSWLIEVTLESPSITYKVTRNGSVVANNLTKTEYRDEHLVSGSLAYQVQAVSSGGTSNPSESYSISLADINVSVDNSAGGTASGGGLYKVGDNVTLRATAHAGYQFKGWKENGSTVSTNTVYTFKANENRTLKASFQKNNGVEDLQESFVLYPNPVKSQLHIESSMVIRQLELVTVDGVVVDTKEVNAAEVECSMSNYAKGVYFLRLVTDEGVVVKKIVLSE